MCPILPLSGHAARAYTDSLPVADESDDTTVLLEDTDRVTTVSSPPSAYNKNKRTVTFVAATSLPYAFNTHPIEVPNYR